ncbi:MAG: CoA-binding protein [Candidatus Aminicenantia bacterium]
MKEEIQNFIESKNIAVVGASPSRKKFGNTAYRALKSRGYNVFPVHFGAKSVEGDTCFQDLMSLPAEVEAALIVISPEKANRVIGDAVRAGIKKIWFQQGADFTEAAEKAKSSGMEVVTGKCILLYAPPVKGFHAAHRFFVRLFGKL